MKHKVFGYTVMLFLLQTTSFHVLGASQQFCRQYSLEAINQYQEAVSLGIQNQNPSIWSDNYQYHYDWCIRVPEVNAKAGAAQRRDLITQNKDHAPIGMSVRESGGEVVKSKEYPLSTGNAVPVGSYEAIGILNRGGCSATLIEDGKVLTAAHCVCNGRGNCSSQATFTLVDVFPIDNSGTPDDESASRTDITIRGRVVAHPEFELRGWAREDFAYVLLDQPASTLAPGVKPIALGKPDEIPVVDEELLLIGFGNTGNRCGAPAAGKRSLKLRVTETGPHGILFTDRGRHACPGDSGGPVINGNGHVVGVSSHTDMVEDSTYRPTYPHYYWIYEHPVQLVSLKSVQNNKYVRAGVGRDALLAASSPAVREWENFRIIRFDNNQSALQSVQNGKYVRAGLGNNSLLGAVSNDVRGWEKFSMRESHNGRLVFRSVMSNQYVRAGIGENVLLGAASARTGAWETFLLEAIQ